MRRSDAAVRVAGSRQGGKRAPPRGGWGRGRELGRALGRALDRDFGLDIGLDIGLDLGLDFDRGAILTLISGFGHGEQSAALQFWNVALEGADAVLRDEGVAFRYDGVVSRHGNGEHLIYFFRDDGDAP